MSVGNNERPEDHDWEGYLLDKLEAALRRFDARILRWLKRNEGGHDMQMPAAPSQEAVKAEQFVGLRFGLGGIAVSTGTLEGEPAVFVREPPAPGVVGESVPNGKEAPLRVAMLFPTKEQAKAVADALVIAPQATSRDAVDEAVLDAIAAARSRLGALRPSDDECGEQSIWDGLTRAHDILAALAPSPPANAGQAVACWRVQWRGLPPQFVEGGLTDEDVANLNTTDATCTPLYTAPTVAAEDAKDAARYRWLRDNAGFGFQFTLQERREPDEWNADVDAAMQRQAGGA